MKNKILNPLSMLVIGILLGIMSRLFDMYTNVLCDVFSEFAIWVLFGTLISIYSKSRVDAMKNILPFCIGMLISYYTVAVITHGVYNTSFIIGWTIFALVSPLFAYLTYMTKENNKFSKIIGILIVLFSILSSIILFDKLRFYDYIIDFILIYFLFIKKIDTLVSIFICKVITMN